MIEFLKHVLNGQNQFASGGLLLMLIGAIGAYLRELPMQLWYWVVRQTTMMITVKDDDAAFVWVKEWFLEQNFLKRVRRIDLDTTLRSEKIALIPAPGLHWFWYARRPFQVWFTRSENTRKHTARRVESLTFRTLGRKQAFLKKFVDDVVSCHTKRMGVQSWLYTYNDGWEHSENYTPRLLESVVLDPGTKEHLVQDVTRFRAAKHHYLRLGVPYHRGYLLYGPPGTGKTSLVSALAAHFALSVYCVNLTEFDDRSLMAAVSQIPKNSVLLFEDIDCMETGQARGRNSETEGDKKQSGRKGVTLSGLLNVLDGFYAPTGVLFMMTTNHMEVLDAALLRPGRIDYKLYLGNASIAQKIELYRRFFLQAGEHEARAFVDAHPWAQTMADFQGLLLEHAEEQEFEALHTVKRSATEIRGPERRAALTTQ
ncbi:MAG TPA: AAA family ATPase [Candidatus Sulfotelmatobacter sp.]|nr:AAA family ATPase [Candidatus Sulfotelmatobacter sp.]